MKTDIRHTSVWCLGLALSSGGFTPPVFAQTFLDDCGLLPQEPQSMQFLPDSPNGRYRLSYAPAPSTSEDPRYRYSLSDKGKPAWEIEKSYVLWCASVTNSGRVVGVAYTTAAEPDALGYPVETYHIIILDRSGEEILHEKLRRAPLTVDVFLPKTAPPYALNALANDSGTSFLVRSVEPDDSSPLKKS